MGIIKLDQYRSDGRLKLIDDGWCVYAAFADPGNGRGLVKVGRTTRPLQRIYEVHCGSPYGIEMALWAFVGSKGAGMSVERAIHSRFRERRTRGEWFEFDFSSPEDKEQFHAVTKVCFARATAKRLEWNRVSMEQVRTAMGLKQFPWTA